MASIEKQIKYIENLIAINSVMSELDLKAEQWHKSAYIDILRSILATLKQSQCTR